MPGQVLDRVINPPDADDEDDDADAEWTRGEQTALSDCRDPRLFDWGDQVWITCSQDSPLYNGWTGRQAHIFIKRFDYGIYECAGEEGALESGGDRRPWPSDTCIALWQQVDARKDDFVDAMMMAMENGWRIEPWGVTTGTEGRAELVQHRLSPGD
ncbi:hypothetical protein DDZ18_11095 [Marinicauda salina]|uniref:Uncharacterized protein n=1 Tax=Marinicauda salina TaxID=2135793 RepID=A0A2U2BRX1_9PROT|nr:hypothetical protein DDZ18_11095 [Marinicauda salina]